MIKQKLMRILGIPDWNNCPMHGYQVLEGIKPKFNKSWLDMYCQPSHKNIACKECYFKWQEEFNKQI